MLPILPRNKKNPLNNREELVRAKKELRSRYASVSKELKAYFNAIPFTKMDVITGRVVNQTVRYDYGLDPLLLNGLNNAIDGIIDKWMLEGAPNGFWFNNFVSIQYEQGTAMAQANLASISATYQAVRPSLESILFSAPYQRRIGLVHAATLDDWKELTAANKTDLRKVMREAMAAGENPNKITGRISKRLNVSLSYANNLARTEMGQAQREARRQEAEDAAQTLSVFTKMLHISALKPNSRATHIARHGEVHTREEDRLWYGKDGNRYRCQCSQTEVLTDDKGNVLELMQSTINRANKQKKQFRAKLKSEGIVLK